MEEFYRLKEDFKLEDGNLIENDIDLKKIQEDNDGLIKLETVGEHNVKRVFWAKKTEIKKIKNNVNVKIG